MKKPKQYDAHDLHESLDAEGGTLDVYDADEMDAWLAERDADYEALVKRVLPVIEALKNVAALTGHAADMADCGCDDCDAIRDADALIKQLEGE